MTLKEALQVNKTSIVPGAVYRNSYVFIDDEDTERPYRYIPDMEASKPETWILTEDMLDSLVIYALDPVWTPVSNFIF